MTSTQNQDKLQIVLSLIPCSVSLAVFLFGEDKIRASILAFLIAPSLALITSIISAGFHQPNQSATLSSLLEHFCIHFFAQIFALAMMFCMISAIWSRLL